MSKKVRLGISACLLGKNVRWNAEQKLDPYLTHTFGQFIEYVPVCPETEAGFSVPREPMRLVGDPRFPRIMTIKTKKDHTNRMLRWTKKRIKALEQENLCGFILKSRSPSCGIKKVKVYSDKGSPAKKGSGLFSRELMGHFPFVPAVEDESLYNPAIRENFLERVFILKRWREVLIKKKSIGRLVDFHTRNQLIILSHSLKHAGKMRVLVEKGKTLPINKVFSQYEKLLMEALSFKTTVKKNFNVLRHIMGYFNKQLTPDEKQELLEIFQQYLNSHVPLVVPITLINHYVRKYDQPYLKLQTYLNPHLIELKLRTYV